MTKSVKPPVELKKKVFSVKQKLLPNFQSGIKAEAIALQFLIAKGYKLVAQNIRLANCELDLIVLDRQFDELVFVEVKYRHSDKCGGGELAVDQRKLAKMNQVARVYLRQKRQFQKSYRFDIISITGRLEQPQIDHFENVTWL